MTHAPTLHALCGKIASGKSTLATTLAQAKGTVLIKEDAWLETLFAEQLVTGADYVQHTTKLRAAMAPHICALLNAGLSVVLDFAANTVTQRNWVRQILEQTNAAHQMHVLDTPDAVCLERLRARNKAGTHEFAVSEAMFHGFAKHFSLPTQEEGFNLIWH